MRKFSLPKSALLKSVIIVGFAFYGLAASAETENGPATETGEDAAITTQAVTLPVIEPKDGDVIPDLTEKRHGFLSDHLEIGLGMAFYSLADNKGQGRFLGSIDELEAESDSFVFPVVGLYLNRYIGLECRYEQYGARIYTDTINNHSDGVLEISGPVVSLMGRLPLDTVARLFNASEKVMHWTSRVVPFAGIGMTFFDESLNADSWWALGYSSPEQYEAAGSPTQNNHGYHRSFALKGKQATTFTLGAALFIGNYMSLNAAWTQAEMDIDGSFYLAGNPGGTGTIPFHYSTTSLDLRYRF